MIIGFDADDTLRHNEDGFQASHREFETLLSDYGDPTAIEERLFEIESRNMPKYGYGVKAYTLSLIECATGEYPYDDRPGITYIDMVQTVLESPSPKLPRDSRARCFSPEMREFFAQLLQKRPENRLPAEILLGSPWLIKHGATSLDAAARNVRQWIATLQ